MKIWTLLFFLCLLSTVGVGQVDFSACELYVNVGGDSILAYEPHGGSAWLTRTEAGSTDMSVIRTYAGRRLEIDPKRNRFRQTECQTNSTLMIMSIDSLASRTAVPCQQVVLVSFSWDTTKQKTLPVRYQAQAKELRKHIQDKVNFTAENLETFRQQLSELEGSKGYAAKVTRVVRHELRISSSNARVIMGNRVLVRIADSSAWLLAQVRDSLWVLDTMRFDEKLIAIGTGESDMSATLLFQGEMLNIDSTGGIAARVSLKQPVAVSVVGVVVTSGVVRYLFGGNLMSIDEQGQMAPIDLAARNLSGESFTCWLSRCGFILALLMFLYGVFFSVGYTFPGIKHRRWDAFKTRTRMVRLENALDRAALQRKELASHLLITYGVSGILFVLVKWTWGLLC